MNVHLEMSPADRPAGEAPLVAPAGEEAPIAMRGFQPPPLRQYWRAVVRRRWIIGGIMLACILAGLIATLLLPERFTSTTSIEIAREQKQITNVQGLESTEAWQDIEFYATQYTLLEARPVIERVARQLNLYNSPAFFSAHGLDFEEVNQEHSELEPAQRKAKVERLVIETLEHNVIIDPVRTSRLVDISYTSRSPELSTQIANAWAESFIRVNMDRQFASSADAREFLEERLETLRGRLEDSEREMITYASRRNIINIDRARDEEGRSIPTRTLVATDLEALNSALNTARADRVRAQARAGGSGEATAEAVSSPGLAALRERRAELAAEYAKLMTQFEPGYPLAQALNEQIRTLDQAIRTENARISNSRQGEYAEALRREQELERRVEQLKGRLDQQQRASIQYAVLQREADTNRQLYDALLQRYKEIGVTGAVGASNISIVESAQVPFEPSFPSIPLNLALSLFAGVVLSSIAVLALEHVDEGIRSIEQAKDVIDIPLLGYTPSVDEEPVELLRDTKSHFYEANFSIQSSLAFATHHGFPRSLSVASTRSGEGKSSIALAMAVVMSRRGRKVLLIDGDMRSPSVHHLLGIANNAGLANLLTGATDWRAQVQPTSFENLDAISAGPIPPNAAELLSSNRLSEVLADALAIYDNVVIDSPPVMGLSDALIIARAVEGSVFVMQADVVPVPAIQNSINRLKSAGTKLFGAVLTKVNEDDHSYGYGYGYDYGHGSSEKEGDHRAGSKGA
jgi:capsular exopolysaccharide synthesis family protein